MVTWVLHRTELTSRALDEWAYDGTNDTRDIKESPGTAGAPHRQICRRETWQMQHQTPADRKSGH